jgi:hypothetical protein
VYSDFAVIAKEKLCTQNTLRWYYKTRWECSNFEQSKIVKFVVLLERNTRVYRKWRLLWCVRCSQGSHRENFASSLRYLVLFSLMLLKLIHISQLDFIQGMQNGGVYVEMTHSLTQ